jgi:hypothetical protein
MTTPNRPPLWEEMQAAYFKGRNPGLNDRHGYAAEIRALRDWLVPEGLLTADETDIRDMLTAEADRAERGDA